MLKRNKIIIDTNLWISFLISKNYVFIDKLIQKKQVKLVFCNELLAEFLQVVKRPKLEKYFQNEDVVQLIEIIDQFAEFYTLKSIENICRDPKDNFLLALANESDANFLITGDKDLLEIKKFKNTEIITISDYKEFIQR
jgi:putative PIN family toxin of toxin-antitoxin system